MVAARSELASITHRNSDQKEITPEHVAVIAGMMRVILDRSDRHRTKAYLHGSRSVVLMISAIGNEVDVTSCWLHCRAAARPVACRGNGAFDYADLHSRTVCRRTFYQAFEPIETSACSF